MITVLITGCSMHSNDLIDVLRDNYDDEEIRIVGINCEDTALLRKGVDAGYVVPRITEDDYVPTLIDICKKEKVDVVLPFITAELPVACRYKKQLEAIGTKVSITSKKSLDLVGDKTILAEMYPGLMPKQNVFIPGEGKDISKEVTLFMTENGYPDKKFCIKLPDKCGGLGFAIIDEEKGLDLSIYNKFGQNRYITIRMLDQLLWHVKDRIIIQEYEYGTDYSVCILAEKGEVKYMLGFEASLMSFGSAMFAEIKDNDEAYRIAVEITKDTGLDGNACFDFIMKEDGSVRLLEANPRVSATLPFIAKAGLNLPYLRVVQLMGKDVSQYHPEVNRKLRMSKNYESEYFV